MKTYITTFVLALVATTAFAQPAENVKYQAVVRDASSIVVDQQDVTFQMTILKNAVDGEVVYQETFTATTTAAGLVEMLIGNGNAIVGEFSTIDWSSGAYFLETAMDLSAGSDYTVMGTSQFLSVPYSLYSKSAGKAVNMTEEERLALSDPNSGMIIWCTDCGSGELQVHNGSEWTNMIGEPVQ